MTVLVGVLCSDGVVIGADSSATFSAAGQLRTIEQPAQKVFLIGADMIYAITGSLGLGQRFEFILEQVRNDKQWGSSHAVGLGTSICQNMMNDMARTQVQKGTFGALVAFHCKNGFRLCEFASADFQPEFKTPKSWFVSMGSGQPITDPFLGLLGRTLFRDSQPRLKKASSPSIGHSTMRSS
jgi:20S proteasome alpha/beta subunit